MIQSMTITLQEIAEEQPYPDYQQWWPMGSHFLTAMSQAILQSWQETTANHKDHSAPNNYFNQYIKTVYFREARSAALTAFRAQDFSKGFYSGEFDAASYAYFRSAFENILAQQAPLTPRAFTQRVGKRFFTSLVDVLQIDIPDKLSTPDSFSRIQESIKRIGDFLVREGYLRDRFAFTFEVDLVYKGQEIRQSEADFLHELTHRQIGYALYRMGYPAILPSAVYLYHTMGEAQHHSSRTMEELFARAGCQARETDDFDPTGFPANEVIELWEIRPLHQEK